MKTELRNGSNTSKKITAVIWLEDLEVKDSIFLKSYLIDKHTFVERTYNVHLNSAL